LCIPGDVSGDRAKEKEDQKFDLENSPKEVEESLLETGKGKKSLFWCIMGI